MNIKISSEFYILLTCDLSAEYNLSGGAIYLLWSLHQTQTDLNVNNHSFGKVRPGLRQEFIKYLLLK